MGEEAFVRLNLPDRTYQASVRSEMKKIAESVGFKAHRLGEAEIIIAELTSNLVKHTLKGGYILIRGITTGSHGIEILSVDDGPGMHVPAEMMKDGRSTTKTLGHGLGAIKRLSDEFDLYSLKGWGTIILSRTFVDKNHITKKTGTFEVEGLNVCKPGEKVSGDSWKFSQQGKKIKGIIVDGLGHGSLAHDAAEEAIEVFSKSTSATPVDQLRTIHQSLKRTRGAVMNIINIDMINHQIVYSGVGNIAMKIISYPQAKSCYAYNGIVGHIMPSALNNHTLQWQATDMIIAHSDGISGRWDVSKYPNILQHNSLLLCAALYKDHNRGTDDSTVIVGKMKKLNYE